MFFKGYTMCDLCHLSSSLLVWTSWHGLYQQSTNNVFPHANRYTRGKMSCYWEEDVIPLWVYTRKMPALGAYQPARYYCLSMLHGRYSLPTHLLQYLWPSEPYKLNFDSLEKMIVSQSTWVHSTASSHHCRHAGTCRFDRCGTLWCMCPGRHFLVRCCHTVTSWNLGKSCRHTSVASQAWPLWICLQALHWLWGINLSGQPVTGLRT